ncbi:hypothetical protein ARMSODRAFT_1073630 [Armillaria solidipes]|uniref:Uncharacterized protein n=1 Tax=Armillaria solidipes TaxID=1076256 RepID=A0A2H3AJS8_9AGAR|nr:hypothetical protein ARMSODRAFT_1073630 [Armillaria solidipes]
MGLKYYNPVTRVSLEDFQILTDDGTRIVKQTGASDQVDPKTNYKANTALYSTFVAMGFFISHEHLFQRRLRRQPCFRYHTGLVDDSVPYCNAKRENPRDLLVYLPPRQVEVSVTAGRNRKSAANAVDNGTYIGFLVLTLIDVLIPMLIANPDKMIRSNGTKITTLRHPSWMTEIIGLFVALKTDPVTGLLFHTLLPTGSTHGVHEYVHFGMGSPCRRSRGSCLRTKDHHNLDDETIARMDYKGYMRPTKAVTAEIKPPRRLHYFYFDLTLHPLARRGSRNFFEDATCISIVTRLRGAGILIPVLEFSMSQGYLGAWVASAIFGQNEHSGSFGASSGYWHKSEPSGEVWGPWGVGKKGKIVKNSGKSHKIRVWGVLRASDRFENLTNEFPGLEYP